MGGAEHWVRVMDGRRDGCYHGDTTRTHSASIVFLRPPPVCVRFSSCSFKNPEVPAEMPCDPNSNVHFIEPSVEILARLNARPHGPHDGEPRSSDNVLVFTTASPPQTCSRLLYRPHSSHNALCLRADASYIFHRWLKQRLSPASIEHLFILPT